MSQSILKLVRLSEEAVLPYKASLFSPGLDLFAAESVLVPPLGSSFVSTGWSAWVPLGTYGRVTHSSDFVEYPEHHLQVVETTADPEGGGPLRVLLYNHSPDQAVLVETGQKIAQLVCEKVLSPRVVVETPPPS